MTRVVVTSDLHLGITTKDQIRFLRDRIAAEMPDITVLAGDIGERLPNVERCLRLFSDLPGQVTVLAGNHDVWARDGCHSRELLERDLPHAARDAGALWLEDATWRKDSLAVVGSLAWYDYSAADPALPPMPAERYAAIKGRYNMDAHLVDWPESDGEIARRLGDALCARLDQLDADPAVRAILVATHVPLVEAQMCRKPGDLRWGTSTAYFGNLTLGLRVLAYPKVAAIVSGHTHIGRHATMAHPANPDREVQASVVPSDYGNPAYIVVDFDENEGALSVSVARTATHPLERLANLSRMGAGRAYNAFETLRRKAWPDNQPSSSAEA